MSKVTEPMLLDKTGQQLLGAMTKQNELLTAIASGYNYKPTSIADVFAVVQSGKANQVFNYGDQIILPWTDKATGKTYECRLMWYILEMLHLRMEKQYRECWYNGIMRHLLVYSSISSRHLSIARNSYLQEPTMSLSVIHGETTA